MSIRIKSAREGSEICNLCNSTEGGQAYYDIHVGLPVIQLCHDCVHVLAEWLKITTTNWDDAENCSETWEGEWVNEC